MLMKYMVGELVRGWVCGLVGTWASGFVAVGSCCVFIVWSTPLVLSPLDHGADIYVRKWALLYYLPG